MKKKTLITCIVAAFAATMAAQAQEDSTRQERIDGFFQLEKKEIHTILINEDVTTHLVMPENIKLVDISTKTVAGNQCADNIVRVKPVEKMKNNQLAGTITLVGERYIAQFKLIYTDKPEKASSMFEVAEPLMSQYTNRDVSMAEADMARYAWSIYNSKKKYYNIYTNAYGMHGQINNIYTIDNYFFIDFSLYNRTKIKYDIEDIRLKLTDKKQTKAANSQTIELQPVWTLNKAKDFKRGYRNIIVIDKLTFPNEKILKLEISEKQISGRVVSIPITYQDVLNADSFDRVLMGD